MFKRSEMLGFDERLMTGAAIVKIIHQAFALGAKDREVPVATTELSAKSLAPALALLHYCDNREFAPDTSAEGGDYFTISVFLSHLEFGDKHRAIMPFIAGLGRRHSFLGRE